MRMSGRILTGRSFRLVSIPLLQYHVGWRDVFPVRGAKGPDAVRRYPGGSRAHWQSVACCLLEHHVHRIRPLTILRTIARPPTIAIHPATTTRRGRFPQENHRDPARPSNDLVDIAFRLRRHHGHGSIRTLTGLRHSPCRCMRNPMGH